MSWPGNRWYRSRSDSLAPRPARPVSRRQPRTRTSRVTSSSTRSRWARQRTSSSTWSTRRRRCGAGSSGRGTSSSTRPRSWPAADTSAVSRKAHRVVTTGATGAGEGGSNPSSQCWSYTRLLVLLCGGLDLTLSLRILPSTVSLGIPLPPL